MCCSPLSSAESSVAQYLGPSHAVRRGVFQDMMVVTASDTTSTSSTSTPSECAAVRRVAVAASTAQVFVDVKCAQAVLRGADVFLPGTKIVTNGQ